MYRTKHIRFLFAICFVLQGIMLRGQDLPAHLCNDQQFPLVPADGLPLAQIFDSKITDNGVYAQHKNKVFYIWGASSPQQPQGTVASKYFPGLRNPDRTRTIDWYKEHHPDWIMYQADRVTPAYGFIYSYGGLAPLDVSNPEVRTYYLNEFILPALKQGYRMVAMDNVNLDNAPKSVGHFSGDRWIERYTGQRGDTAYYNDIIAWLQFLRDNLHPLGIRIAANLKAITAPDEVVKRVTSVVDMWADETGFTHVGKNVTDENWARQFHLAQLIVPTIAYVSVNQIDGPIDSVSVEQLEWVIANFLLCRGPQSLLAIAPFQNKKAIYHSFSYRPEMDIDIGYPEGLASRNVSGAWTRKFSRGMVIVNPSSRASAVVSLPSGSWKTLTARKVRGSITVEPATGIVLQR